MYEYVFVSDYVNMYVNMCALTCLCICEYFIVRRERLCIKVMHTHFCIGMVWQERLHAMTFTFSKTQCARVSACACMLLHIHASRHMCGCHLHFTNVNFFSPSSSTITLTFYCPKSKEVFGCNQFPFRLTPFNLLLLPFPASPLHVPSLSPHHCCSAFHTVGAVNETLEVLWC